MQYAEKQKRLIAWAIACLIFAVISLSGLFIATHAEHDCTGEDCAVCAELEACETVIRGIGRALAWTIAVAIVWNISGKRYSFGRIRYFAGSASLVSLKIRLNN